MLLSGIRLRLVTESKLSGAVSSRRILLRVVVAVWPIDLAPTPSRPSPIGLPSAFLKQAFSPGAVSVSIPMQTHVINGELAAPVSDQYIDLINPSTGEIAGRGADGDAADVDIAVAAAKRRRQSWPLPVQNANTPP